MNAIPLIILSELTTNQSRFNRIVSKLKKSSRAVKMLINLKVLPILLIFMHNCYAHNVVS